MSVEGHSFYSVPHFEIDSQHSQSRSYNYNPMHSDYLHDTKSHCIIPLTQKKSNTNSIKNQDDKSFTKNQLDLSDLMHNPNRIIQKQPIIVRTHRSLIPQALHRKVRNKLTEITVFYFNTNRKLVFTRNQLMKKFVLGNEVEAFNKEPGVIKNLIPYLVKQYCKLFLNFEPLEVNYENFQIKITGFNGQDDPLIEPFDQEEQIPWLFECGNLLLVRKQKDYERLRVWQKNYAENMEILEIIIPFQRQIIEQVQKNKTLNSLKQKLISYNQLGNIVIVTYGTFTVCQPKKKISQIVAIDRILQVYRLEISAYEDVDTSLNRQKNQILIKQQPMLYPKQNRSIIDAEFQVSQNFYSGKLYIQILGTKIIQKYEGGIISYIMANQRRVQRSVHTLVGISCEKTKVKMKFMSKFGTQICQYQFQSKTQVQTFFKCIMRIGRELKQNFQKIPK